MGAEMKHRFIAVATLALTACADPQPRLTGPITCDSFATQADAQKFLEEHIEHAITLDPANTGVACKGMAE
jgi:hypothetical protein